MTSPKNAWVQLYQARQMRSDIVESRPPGRPPSPVPRRKVGLTLSQGEINELETWQQRFSNMVGRKISTGETVGILTRICSARLSRLSGVEDLSELADLVDKMVAES
jgi:hypothetical protein